MPIAQPSQVNGTVSLRLEGLFDLIGKDHGLNRNSKGTSGPASSLTSTLVTEIHRLSAIFQPATPSTLLLPDPGRFLPPSPNVSADSSPL